MRMWMVDPRAMCDQHLLGEHVELHMLTGTLLKNISVAGYVNTGLVETHNIEKRHAELVAEMERRGMKHKSPLPHVEVKSMGKVDREASLKEMARRCPACSKKQLQLLESTI